MNSSENFLRQEVILIMNITNQDCHMLRNRKFMGKLQEQFIRTKSKPLITEVDAESSHKIQANSENEHNNQKIKSLFKLKNVDLILNKLIFKNFF